MLSVEKINNLEKENEWLKTGNKLLKSTIKQINSIGLIEENEKYKAVLQDIKAIAENIINNEDKPACVNDKECPLNDGIGFDNHCNIKCPFVLAKLIITKAEV